MKKTTSFILLAALAPCLGTTAVQKTYSVTELVALLLQVNPALRAQDRSLDIESAALRLERRLPNPQLAVAIGSGKPLAGNEEARRLWAFGIEWPLPNPLARIHALRGGQWQERAWQHSTQAERRQRVHEFKSRLYEWQCLAAQHRIQAEMVADLERIAGIIDARFAAGEALRLDSLWARSALALAQNRQREISDRIAGLDQEIHAGLDGALPLGIAVDENEAPPPPLPARPILEARLKNAPAAESRRAWLAMSGALLSAGRSDWFPSVTLHVERAREVDASIWKGGMALELPLFSGSWSRLPLLRYQRERAELELRRQELQDQGELARRLAEIATLNKALAALEGGELASGREALRLAESGLRAGELSLLQVMEARKTFLELSLRRPELVARLRTAHSALAALLGE